ncbi:MAG: DUF1275 domain-containing protein [Gemmatimonadetes bacterium]|nr:DUF1275 domain-containing protein [Gemmatimonadota bacterium]
MLPIVRDLAHSHRTGTTNRRLGAALAFVAGAANAGGFLAVGRYTSHMTGIVSAMADDLVLGQLALAASGFAALLAFLVGATSTTIAIHWARRRRLRSLYALPLLLEAVLLLAFGLIGGTLTQRTTFLLPATVVLLCFLMGLQNAVITKVSRAEIRTTHVTGLVTDLGIELGKLFYLNRLPVEAPVLANRARLRVHLLLIGCFFVGGVSGAYGFKRFGYGATIPLALLLGLLAARPLLEDLELRFRLWRRRRPGG